MPFVLPTFPMQYYVWHQWTEGVSEYGAPDSGGKCNLSPGRRVMLASSIDIEAAYYVFPMELLVPKGEDLRPQYSGNPSDVVEVPKGSQMLYRVSYVDDIGAGFANEHRYAMIHRAAIDMIFADITISVPVPLPPRS